LSSQLATERNALYNDRLRGRTPYKETEGDQPAWYEAMTKYRIIVNPTANRGGGKETIPEIESRLRGHALNFDLVCTERPWHAAELTQEAVAAGVEVVVAAGGDGTANEVLNGLMRVRQAGLEPCALGVLCIGRGNDFAYGVGIPPELEAGCLVLAEGARRPIDVGLVKGGLYPEGRYFGNGIGIGFDAVVGFEAAKMTRLSGFPSYLVAVLKTVFLYYKAPLTRIQYEDQQFTQPSLMISVMNGQRMGGGFMMAPDGLTDDGLLDLCIARQVSRPRIFGLIPHFLRGTQASQEPVRTGKTQRILVTALEGVLPAHADGETLCIDGQELEVRLLPRQIQVVTARPGAGEPGGP
jgi:diacylglycerol kinase (ATP)